MKRFLKRFLFFCFCILLLARSAGAQESSSITPPKQHHGLIGWVKKHPTASRVILKIGVASAAAGIHAHGLHVCRLHNRENCDGAYGNAWVIFGVITAATFIEITNSEACRKYSDWKSARAKAIGCDVLFYPFAGYQAARGGYEWSNGGPPEIHVDPSHLELVHRKE